MSSKPSAVWSRPFVTLVLAAVTALLLPGVALAHHDAPFPTFEEKGRASDASDVGPFSAHQHGGDHGHLPAKAENVELVSKFEPLAPFGGVVEGEIADLSVFKSTAYLNSWDEPSCQRGGVYTVDISEPARPRQLGFIDALDGNYHGEGAHVITASTRKFNGDLLAVNNEFCSELTQAPARGGGFDLYDVSDPAQPKVLVQGFGDFGKEGVMTGSGPLARTYHSVFLWQAGDKVYAVGVDNEELHDVDIFDVSDPRSPRPVAEHDLAELFPSIREQPAPLNDEVFLHDMVVKNIGGRFVMSASYWDGGYVILDVTNPAKPQLLRDSDFGANDPLVGDPETGTGISPPEGNAHQSEFSPGNEYLLAADEDFAPYRVDEFFTVDASGRETEAPAAEVGGGTSLATLPDRTLNGPVVYGGYGCPGSQDVPPATDAFKDVALAPGEEKIVVLQRGPAYDPSEDYDQDGDTDNDAEDACFPGDKALAAKRAGYNAVLIVNRHQASGSAADDEPYCGAGGYHPEGNLVTLCTDHATAHKLFGDEPSFEIPADDQVELAPIGTRGTLEVKGTSVFDGWGYAHLYRNAGTKMERVDSFAIPEALDPAYSDGFGDLSIHELATDPDTNLAYSSYYSGGVRVFRYGPGGLTQVGAFIDEGGNNFWGVEQFTQVRPNGRRVRYFAGSDRDHGLYIFRYTGP